MHLTPLLIYISPWSCPSNGLPWPLYLILYHLHILLLVLCPYCSLHSTYTAVTYLLAPSEKVNRVSEHFVWVILNSQWLGQCLLT